jgi:hypothetical protein
VVSKSIKGDKNIEGCDFDEADPSNFIIKLYNHDDHTLELRFIKIDNNNECTCKLSIVDLKDIKLKDTDLNYWMTSLVTSLNNYLVLIGYRRVVFIYINENKVLIQAEVDGWERFSVHGTYGVIIINSTFFDAIINSSSLDGIIIKVMSSASNEFKLLHYNAIKNELEVKRILLWCGYRTDNKIPNDHLIVNLNKEIYIYKLDDIKMNNKSKSKSYKANEKVIKKKAKQYCISSDKKYFIFTTPEDELFVYKLDDEIKQIACLKLNEEMNCLVSSEKYFSMVDKSKENILTFEIIDETI